MHVDDERTTQSVTAFFSKASVAFGPDDAIRRFPHFGRRLVETADLRQGAHVLDVATGRGAVLFPAAERVGPQGSVLGIDIAPGMIEATVRDIQTRGLTNTTVQVMDAEQLEIDAASLDAILCGFGLMFLPHLGHALAGFRRVLKPAGILAVSTWGGSDPRFEWERELQQTYGITNSTAAGLMVQRLHEADELKRVLRDAGFAEVRVVNEIDERVHHGADQWWARSLMAHQTRAALESLGQQGMARFKQDAFDRLQVLTDADGNITQRIEANFAIARKP